MSDLKATMEIDCPSCQVIEGEHGQIVLVFTSFDDAGEALITLCHDDAITMIEEMSELVSLEADETVETP